MKNWLIFLSLLTAFSTANAQVVSTKNVQRIHENWSFKQKNESDWHPATVPGVVHLDLFNNGLIEDPFWEDNEKKLRWIENRNWIYKTTFQVNEETISKDHIEIVFYGLDTYAEIYLNSNRILTSFNMFRTWRTSVKPYLKKGANELEVVFTSPVRKNKKKALQYPYELPSGNEASHIKPKVGAFTRKAAYHFGWDWGPRFVTSGIYRPVELVSWNKARLRDAYTLTDEIFEDSAKMRTIIEIEALQGGQYQLQYNDELSVLKLNKGLNKIVHHFVVPDPKLWWCNGSGESILYKQKIALSSDGILLDTLIDTYGIRTIELVNKPDDIGTSFFFKLNGAPIFIKGANYIPQDVFLPRVKTEQYEAIIQSAQEANFNMIRVWGGGIYERDLFYDLCDKNGILVWQDFMFANSLYPKERAFKKNVEQEVIENIRRLRKHPSIALWCGNNEIEVAWGNWGWQEKYDYSKRDCEEIWNNYKSIFHRLIPELVSIHHPGANYTPSSPLSNWGTPENFNHSSMHYWGVWHGKEPFENFEHNVGRFNVEYGFQSFPSISTLKKVISDEHLHLRSKMMRHRQKSYIGSGLIQKHIEQYYGRPKSFEEFITLSQRVQAKALHMAISAHIAKQPHCMGTLFWQLNDCWPGPSWSVIDYYGNKKLAYDVVKKAYAKQ